MPQDPGKFIGCVEELCGRSFNEKVKEMAFERLRVSFNTRTEEDEFGYRQLNEVLLLLNERIVTKGFFLILARLSGDEKTETIQFGLFSMVVYKFRILAMLEYGSFRFAYNWLSTKNDPATFLDKWIRKRADIMHEFEKRKKPLCEINEEIPTEHLHYMGYYSAEGADEKASEAARKIGRHNFDTYLTWDYLDVYVATSMRRPFEFQAVNFLCKEVFQWEELKALGIRYFDPTLNFHEDSIAKSLIEGLMLKRAKCTLYLAQESDTMGKDSELAATLAQGKPVIAYVPKIEDVGERCKVLRDKTFDELITLTFLVKESVEPGDIRQFEELIEIASKIALEDDEGLRKKQQKEHKEEYEALLRLISTYEKKFYDKRAWKLKYAHPLRFQMNLETGVANGVLVVRTHEECKNVLLKLLTGSLDFEILSPGDDCVDKEDFGKSLENNYILIEKSTRSAFRAVTTDEKLTNSFWNLYKRTDK